MTSPAGRGAADLRRDRRGVVALEFAVIGPLLIFLLLAIIEVALLAWAQVALQVTAAQTARCVGIGSSACADPQQYAVTTATSWLYPNAVTTSDVAVASNATCSSAPGHYVRVTITAQFVGTAPLPGVLGGGQLTAQACYFTGA